MTVVPLPSWADAPVSGPLFDIEHVLASIDTMAAQRPVAAQIVSVANSDDTSARALSRILASDVALASRVVKPTTVTANCSDVTRPRMPK